jgi:hypothetical protein
MRPLKEKFRVAGFAPDRSAKEGRFMARADKRSGAAGARWRSIAPRAGRLAKRALPAALNGLTGIAWTGVTWIDMAWIDVAWIDVAWIDVAWAQSSKQVQDAAEEAIRRLDLQTEFPRGPEPLNWHFNLPSETIWIVIAIAVGILLYAFRDLLPLGRGRGSGAWTQDEAALDAVKPGAQTMILGAADQLAAEGRFAEAMHMLLLDGLAHMRQRLDQQLSDSLTSREILRSTNLPAEARAALQDVVARVEPTYFGEYPAAAADYGACRESFNALARSLYGAPA